MQEQSPYKIKMPNIRGSFGQGKGFFLRMLDPRLEDFKYVSPKWGKIGSIFN